MVVRGGVARYAGALVLQNSPALRAQQHSLPERLGDVYHQLAIGLQIGVADGKYSWKQLHNISSMVFARRATGTR